MHILHACISYYIIGTSAFDTCIQKAESHHRGISVEPLSFYQDMLPSPPGVIKENAAMDAKVTDPEVDFGLMYFMDPRDLIAHGFAIDGPNLFMFGISSFGSVQNLLLNAYRMEELYTHTPSIFLQRSRLVPRLSMEELYLKHAVRAVGVVKLDCEGLDLAIMATYLQMLKKYHLPYPCVISYEVLTTLKEFYSTVEMLQDVGYAIIALAYPQEAILGDFFAIHSQCSAQRRSELSTFLPASLGKAEEICNGRGTRENVYYCCIARLGDEDDQVEGCDHNHPFFVQSSTV
jgi:hypothetical protein